jgi:hypothetical protein
MSLQWILAGRLRGTMAIASLAFGFLTPEQNLAQLAFGDAKRPNCPLALLKVPKQLKLLLTRTSVVRKVWVELIPKEDGYNIRYRCPVGEKCREVFQQVLESKEVAGHSLVARSVDDEHLVFELKDAVGTGKDQFADLFQLQSIALGSPSSVYDRGISQIHPGSLDRLEIASFLRHSDNPRYIIPATSYQSGGFSNRTVYVPEKQVDKIVRYQEGGKWQYAVVARQSDQDYLLVLYDGDKILMIKRRVHEVEETYPFFKEFNSGVLRIQIAISKIQCDAAHPWNRLYPFVVNQSLGSDESLEIFKMRSSNAEHRFADYSPKMYERLLELREGLKWPDLLSHAVSARQNATANQRYAGKSDVGVERDAGVLMTHMSAQGRENSVKLLTNPALEFRDSSYTVYNETHKIRRLVVEGLELTGYDLERHEWIHTDVANLRKGMAKIETLYNSILKKKHSSLRELQVDIGRLHWWSIHVMGYKRGTAGIFDFVTKYIFLSKGYLPSRWREEILPDIAALVTAPDEYAETYHSFFEQ